MSNLFVTVPPNTRGVVAVENPPPSVIAPEGTDVSVIVGQFPWGPAETLNYPGSLGDFYNTYAPRGMDRTGSAHLSVIRKGWPVLGAVRVKDPAAVAASAQLKTGGAVLVATVVLKYPGTAGNSVILTVGAADDGNSNHFNLTASVTGLSGTTSEVFRNLNVSGTGADVLPVLTDSLLIGSFTKNSSGVIAAGNTTCTGGTDGTTTSTHYVGTPGGSDFGFALLENDLTINHVFTDDAGNSLRAAVNAGLMAHAELTTDRVGYINGNSGQSASAAQADVASYRSTRIVYVDPWVYVNDDTDGTKRLAPSACWGASIAAQLPPSTAISWRGGEVQAMWAGAAGLEFDRGGARGQNTAAGIATIIKRRQGGFTFEADVNTSEISGETELTRTRMGQFIGRSIIDAWADFVDAPNIPSVQQDMINAVQQFLGNLKAAKNGLNPAFDAYIDDFLVLDPKSANTPASLALGNYTVPTQIQIGSNMHVIYLSMQFGEGVLIQAA